VLRQVIRQGLTLVAIGLGAGVAGAYAFSRLITKFLFATAPTDIMAYAGVMGLFAAAALLACAGPARRATSIDPLSALRSE
jgi:ABC-type antimicrobial peptide transport system permease subunit